MNLRLAITAPLPWLTMFAASIFGKKTVPDNRSIFRLPRSLSITKEGKWFIGVLLLIGVAAINTGNNLLYLVVAALLSLIIISGLMSESTLRGLSATRVLPARIFKGSPVIVRLKAENRKRFFPSFSFLVKEGAGPSVSSVPAYFLKLKPNESALKTSEYTFLKRGLVRLTGLKVSTRFPFGLFIKGKEEPAGEDVLVFPSVRLKTGSLPKDFTSSGGAYSSGKGGGTELYGLRDYTLMDDSRLIHWKSAARASKLLVKEFERDAERKVLIVFENYPAVEKVFEDMVDEAAALANHYIEKGYPVGLRTLSIEIKASSGRGQLMRILKALALITPEGSGSPSVGMES